MSRSKSFRVAFGVALAFFLTAAMGGATAALAQEKLTDSQILGVLSAANGGEIRLGQLASRLAYSGKVRTFAQMTVDAHFAAELKVSAAGSPSSSNLSRKLEAEAAAQLAALQGLAGGDFDRSYVEYQVATLQQLLQIFDKILLPNVRSRDVSALLASLRPMIVKHLDAAQQLRTPTTTG